MIYVSGTYSRPPCRKMALRTADGILPLPGGPTVLGATVRGGSTSRVRPGRTAARMVGDDRHGSGGMAAASATDTGWVLAACHGSGALSTCRAHRLAACSRFRVPDGDPSALEGLFGEGVEPDTGPIDRVIPGLVDADGDGLDATEDCDIQPPDALLGPGTPPNGDENCDGKDIPGMDVAALGDSEGRLGPWVSVDGASHVTLAWGSTPDQRCGSGAAGLCRCAALEPGRRSRRKCRRVGSCWARPGNWSTFTASLARPTSTHWRPRLRWGWKSERRHRSVSNQ